MTKREQLISCVSFTVFVFTILILSGTLFSGVHFVDDHEMLSFSAKIESSGFWNCVREVLSEDLGSRFRPLYYFLRICLSAVLGYNFLVWSVMHGFVIVCALTFAYFCARKLGCNILASVLFALVIMVGPQSVVWWKLGPQESIGTAAFLVGFWFLLRWLENRSWKDCVISAVIFTLLSLYKESYIGTLPFVIVYVVLEHWKNNSYSFKSLFTWVKKDGIFVGWITFVGLVEAVLILFVVGTEGEGYVGLNTDIGLYEYTVIWMDCFKGPLQWFVLFGIIMILIMLTRINHWKEWLIGAVLTFVWMIPQVVFYNMTGLSERYILPWSVGYAWFVVVAAMKKGGVLEGARIRQYLMIACLCGLLVRHFPVLWQEALHHTYRGENFKKAWDIIVNNTDEDDNILTAFSYFESNKTVELWGEVHERKNIYTWIEDTRECEESWTGGLTRTGLTVDFEGMEAIIYYSPEHRHYIWDPSIDFSDFEVQQVGTLMVAIRK